MTQTLGAAGNATGNFALAGEVLAEPEAFAAAGLQLDGLVALSQGFMLTCMVWLGKRAPDRPPVQLLPPRFMLVGAVLAFFGFVHAGTLTPAGGIYEIAPGAGTKWTIGYLLSAGFFALTGWWVDKSGQSVASD